MDIDETVVMVFQERGSLVARFFLNITFAYALASVIECRETVIKICLSFILGYCVMLSFSNRAYVDYTDAALLQRNTAGFLNPNDLGWTSMVVVFMSLFIVFSGQPARLPKFLAIAATLAGLYGVATSASRSAMIGLMVGFIVTMWYSRMANRIRVVTVGCLAIVCVALFIPGEFWRTLSGRVSIDALVETRGSMRVDIFYDYLKRFPSYALTGVGLMRAPEVTINSDAAHPELIPHNAYIEVLVEFGCAGLFLFLLSLRQIWRRLTTGMKNGQCKIIDSIIPGLFLGWAAMILFGSGWSRIFCFSWGIIAAYGAVKLREQIPCRRPEPAKM